MSDATVSRLAVVNSADLSDLLFSSLAAILKIPQAEIDPDRPFDEYGLDSIDAVIATGTLSEQLGVELPPELLLQYRTPAELYRKLSEVAGPAEDAKPDDKSIFLFNGGAGRDGRLARLASLSSPTEPFLYVTYGRWQEWVDHGFSFDDVVTGVYNQIKEQAPSDPLRFAGYSQGGQMAYAVALRCAADGRQVDVLTLLDSDGLRAEIRRPNLRENLGWIKRTTLRVLKSSVQKIRARLGMRTGSPDGYRSGDNRINTLLEWCSIGHSALRTRKGLAWLSKSAPVLFAGRGGHRLDNTIQMQVFLDTWQEWLRNPEIVRAYNAPVVLFRSEEPGPRDFGWAERCSKLDILDVVGGHHAMLEQSNLDEFGALFKQALKI